MAGRHVWQRGSDARESIATAVQVPVAAAHSCRSASCFPCSLREHM